MYRMILNETSYFGAGCRENIAVEAARRGFKKAFFVTDKDLIRFHVADKVIEVFEKNNIPYELFSDVKANPTIANVQHGVFAVDCDAMQAFDQIDVLNKSALIYIAAKNMGFEPDGMSQEQMKEMTVAFNLPK